MAGVQLLTISLTILISSTFEYYPKTAIEWSKFQKFGLFFGRCDPFSIKTDQIPLQKSVLHSWFFRVGVFRLSNPQKKSKGSKILFKSKKNGKLWNF